MCLSLRSSLCNCNLEEIEINLWNICVYYVFFFFVGAPVARCCYLITSKEKLCIQSNLPLKKVRILICASMIVFFKEKEIRKNQKKKMKKV